MPDTQRTVAAILALLADNTGGDISPQDVRDAMVSWQPAYGHIYVAAAGSAAVTISDTTSYFEVTSPTWTAGSGNLFDESGGNGRLTYIGTEPMDVIVNCALSQTTSSANQVCHWRLGVNGTPDASSEIQRKQGTGSDVGAMALQLQTSLTTNDYVSLFVRNATTSSNATVEVAHMQATGFIK